MADIITVTPPAGYRFTLPVGSVAIVAGAGELETSDRHRRQLSATPDTIGPFAREVECHLRPSGSSTVQVINLWRNAGVALVVNDAGANHNLIDDEVGSYLRMIGTGAKTVTARANSVHRLPEHGEWHVRNAAASGDITLTPGDGVTLNAAAGGSLVLEPGMTVTLKRVAVDVFDVIGLTVAA